MLMNARLSQLSVHRSVQPSIQVEIKPNCFKHFSLYTCCYMIYFIFFYGGFGKIYKFCHSIINNDIVIMKIFTSFFKVTYSNCGC